MIGGHTFPPIWGLCGGASNEAFPPVLLGTSPELLIGAEIGFGAEIAGRLLRFVRSDIPLLSDIAMRISCPFQFQHRT